jgi:integrase
MILQKVSLVDYLALKSEEKDRLYKKSGFTYPSDLISHDYPWLLNDYNENNWQVSISNNKSININFDRAIIGGGRISDNQRLIDDMKLFFVIAKTAQFSVGMKLTSESTIRAFFSSLKRYVSEALSIPYITNPKDLSFGEFFDLIQNSANKMGVNLNYPKVLEDYFDNKELSEIPVLRHKTKKQPPKIDITTICNELGIYLDALNTHTGSKVVVAQKSLELKSFYNEDNFEISYPESLNVTCEKKMTHKKCHNYFIKTLQLFHLSKSISGDLFNYNFIPYNVDEVIDTVDYESPDFNEMLDLQERTRDIPPMLFLEMMDAASRFVLDYSDELFEAEKHFSAIYDNELAKDGDSHEAGKRTNLQVRCYKATDDRLHSPFPMRAYKHASDRTGTRKHSNEVYEAIATNMANGVLRNKSMKDLNLTKGQYQAIRLSILASKTKKLSLQKALYQYLPFCCVVIIFALTARRESEVFGLEVGCINKDLDGLLWLNSYVAKTLQKHADFTTVSLVEKAVSILERMSENGRKKTNTNSLFVFDDAFDRPPTTMKSINSIANDFFDFIGIERDSDGKHFKLSEHQFRRFFAIMFYYRYESSNVNIDALMHELAHVDWGMTAHYLTEKETGRHRLYFYL